MATFFVVSDVHSFYDEMILALNTAGFDIDNDSHIFVSLGDLLDRGTQPEECLKFVNRLPKNRKILIKGNHEYLMEQAIKDKVFRSYDYHNGTIYTAQILSGCNWKTDSNTILTKVEYNQLWNDYINSCIDYYENDKYVFVHGWIPCVKYTEGVNLFGDEINSYEPLPDWHIGNWERAGWYNGMDCWNQGIRIDGKTILCGHYHSSWGHCYLHNQGVDFPKEEQDLDNWITTEFIDDGIICLDACTVLSNKVNCVKLYKQKRIL